LVCGEETGKKVRVFVQAKGIDPAAVLALDVPDLPPPPPDRPPRVSGVPEPLEELQTEAEDTLRTSKDDPPLPVGRSPLGTGGSPRPADVRPLPAEGSPLAACVSTRGFCVAPLAANVSPLPAGGLLPAVRVSPLPAERPRLPADASLRPANARDCRPGGSRHRWKVFRLRPEARRCRREVLRDRPIGSSSGWGSRGPSSWSRRGLPRAPCHRYGHA